MATKVGHISREKGKMYYVKGNGDVMAATMNRKGGKKGRSFCKVQPKGHQEHAKPMHKNKKKSKKSKAKKGGHRQATLF